LVTVQEVPKVRVVGPLNLVDSCVSISLDEENEVFVFPGFVDERITCLPKKKENEDD
jgi:hypothetical protein